MLSPVRLSSGCPSVCVSSVTLVHVPTQAVAIFGNFFPPYYICDDINKYYLENLDFFKDLGVIFDSRLSFREQIHDQFDKAYKMLGIIKRNFIHITPNTFIML